jgi:hypothetical protein
MVTAALRPGEENAVLRVRPSATAPEVPQRLKLALPQIGFRVCYCSVLDQCWIGDLKSTRTQPVRQCKPAEHPYAPNGR